MNNIETKHLKTRWIHLFNNTMHKFFINKNVLDIGCLDGYSTNNFIKNNAKSAIGIDIEPSYIEQAKLEYPNIVFKTEDAEQLNSFEGIDVISCLGLIYFLKDPVKFLKKLAIQKNANTIIIETVFNNGETYFNDNLCFLNIDIIKSFFIDDGWQISFEKMFKLKHINNKEFNFGNRIIVVFERQP